MGHEVQMARFVGPGVTPSRGKTFLLAILFLFLLQAATLLAANVIVDPRSEFPSDRFRPLSADAQTIKIGLYEDLDQDPDTLILANSRLRRLDPSDLEPAGMGPTFNFAAGGAGIDDALALFRWAQAETGAPQNLVIGLDLFQLRPGVEPSLRLSSIPELRPHLEDRATARDYATWALQEATNLDYARDTALVLWYTATGYPPERTRYLADGGFLERGDPYAAYVNNTKGRAALEAQIPVNLAIFESFQTPDVRAWRLLELLLDEARAAGSDVTLVLPPYHPDFYRLLLEETPFASLHAAVMDRLIQRCPAGSLSILDLSDLATLGPDAEPNAFSDTVHPRGINTLLMAQAIAAREPDACRPVARAADDGAHGG